MKHHRDVPVLRVEFVDEFSVNVQLSLSDFFKTGDHPQSSRFATSGRTYQHYELFIPDFDAEILYGNYTAFGFF